MVVVVVVVVVINIICDIIADVVDVNRKTRPLTNDDRALIRQELVAE